MADTLTGHCLCGAVTIRVAGDHDPRVGAWELIRTALGYTLTLPLGIPLYQEADYLPHAIECLLACLLKTDV